jgi:ATP-dependent DNA helicase MPH1
VNDIVVSHTSCIQMDLANSMQEMLNEHSGLLKATKFVGQSQGKQEDDKGFTQKEQKQVRLWCERLD